MKLRTTWWLGFVLLGCPREEVSDDEAGPSPMTDSAGDSTGDSTGEPPADMGHGPGPFACCQCGEVISCIAPFDEWPECDGVACAIVDGVPVECYEACAGDSTDSTGG